MDKSHLLCSAITRIDMANGYYLAGLRNQITYLDVFFRLSGSGGYCIFAGLSR